MAESLFGVPKISVNIKFNEGAIKNLPNSELKTFRRFWAVDVKVNAQLLSKQRLSKISGPSHDNWHRPFAQPGRTGNYDKGFRVRTRVNAGSVTLVLVNIVPYSLWVEAGSRSKNYVIVPSPGKRLFFWSYSNKRYVFSKGVTHPGPWQSGTANSKGREANPAFGEIGGKGAWIQSDAVRLAVASALSKATIKPKLLS